MQVVAAGVRGPLVADEGGEAARLVVFLRGGDRLLPGAAIGARAREVHEILGERALREGDDDLDRRLRALAGLDHVVPFAARRIGQDLGLAGEQVREEAHVVGVIGDHQEVERTRQLHRLAAGRRDLLAPGEAIGVARAEPRAEGAGVHRERRVQMRVAEERPRREIAAGIGRVGRFGRVDLSAVSLSSVPTSEAAAVRLATIATSPVASIVVFKFSPKNLNAAGGRILPNCGTIKAAETHL